VFEDGVDEWDSIKLLTTKEDIKTMAKSFVSRSVMNGKIIFGTNRSKFLKATVNWVQDSRRVSDTPSIVGLNEGTFKEQLQRADTRNKICKALKSNDVPRNQSSHAGSLDKESKWKEWEEKFVNYLRLYQGANGIPLSYIICANDDPDTNGIWNQTDFIRETIACAPLSGEYFNTDKLTVYNLIISFTTGQPSGDWVKKTEKDQDNAIGQMNGWEKLSSADKHLVYKQERKKLGVKFGGGK
jgi:hypothetical protein